MVKVISTNDVSLTELQDMRTYGGEVLAARGSNGSLSGRFSGIDDAIGNLTGLTTTVKTSLTAAVNENVSKIGSVSGFRPQDTSVSISDKVKNEFIDRGINIDWYDSLKTPIADGFNYLPAINQAIADAKTTGVRKIILSPKTYLITNSITIPSDFEIVGSGFSSVIKMSSTVSAVTLGIKNEDFTNGNNNIVLRDFTLDLNRQARGLGEDAGGHGIRIQALEVRDGSGNITTVNQCKNIRIERVWVKNSPNAGMMLFSVKNVWTKDCVIEDTMRDGISVWFNSENIQHTNNLMFNVRDDCYGFNSEVTGHANTQIKNVTVTGGILSHASDAIYGCAVRLAGVDTATVTGVDAHDIQGTGMVIEGGFLSGTSMPTKRATISGCTIKTTGFNISSGGHGIGVSSAIGCELTGNVIQDYYLNGVNISATASDINVNGGTIYEGRNSNGCGVVLDGASNSIRNVTIINTKNFGVAINADDNQVNSNKIKDCCTVNSGNSYIRVAANVNYAQMNDNKLRKITAGYGTYGIRIATGTSTGCLAVGNHARGFAATNGVSSGGTGTNTLANNLEI